MGAPGTTPGWSLYAGDPLVIVNAAGSSLGEMSAGDPYISRSEMMAERASSRRVLATALIASAGGLFDDESVGEHHTIAKIDAALAIARIPDAPSIEGRAK